MQSINKYAVETNIRAIDSDDYQIEELRKILSRQMDREVALTEASEIAQSLVNFFNVLSDDYIGIGDGKAQ